MPLSRMTSLTRANACGAITLAVSGDGELDPSGNGCGVRAQGRGLESDGLPMAATDTTAMPAETTSSACIHAMSSGAAAVTRETMCGARPI